MFDDKVAVVTGGAQGLGRAIVTLLVQRLVNGVSPGSIATERAHAEGWLPRATARIRLGRAAEPEDIAEVVLFLASSANRFITGETIFASGGEIMD